MGGGSGSGKGAPVSPMTVTATVQPGRAAMSRDERRLSRSDSFETVSTSATTNSSSASTCDGMGGPVKTPKRRRPQHPPRGLLNLGNTCYANAALQCLFATALPHALLDHKKAAVFRRYASNGNLLAMGSGSADSWDDDEDWIGGGTDDERAASGSVGLAFDDDGGGGFSSPRQQREADEERRTRREERRKRKEKRQKEREKRAQRELCNWLTAEMTELTRNFTAAPRPAPEPGSGGLFESLFGGSSPPPLAAVDPGSITRNVHKLCKTLRPYQQEDAHEFLRALLSGLVMEGQNRKLSALFDGLLESAVTCQTCRYSSLTRDRYMDLSLDIANRGVTDLPQALRHFTKTEMLDEDNMVVCGRCKEKRIVSKGLRLATAPTVLVVQLKRFAFDMYGRMVRLNKDVKYPLRLEIGEYMSRANRSTPPPYELVGVLVHSGRTCDSGHYLSYVKTGRKWYKANDAVVSEVSEDVALNQKPYILVYEVAGMKAKHGCDSYHRYHREAENGARDDSAGSMRRSESAARCQSAPRPTRGGDGGACAAAPALERGNSDDLEARKRSNRRGTSANSPDCFAFSSLFGLLDLCGAANDVVEDDGGRRQEYQEAFSRDASLRTSGRSIKVENGSTPDEAPPPPPPPPSTGDNDKDVIGIPNLSPASSRRKKRQTSPPPSPRSTYRMTRSASSNSARDLELNAARAYRKPAVRKRSSMAPEVEAPTSGRAAGKRTDHSLGMESSRSSSSGIESDYDSDTASGAVTDIVVGGSRSKKGHRRAKSLSRLVHRAAAKTSGMAEELNKQRRQPWGGAGVMELPVSAAAASLGQADAMEKIEKLNKSVQQRKTAKVFSSQMATDDVDGSPESDAAEGHPPALVRKGCALAGFGGVSAPLEKVPELPRRHHHHHSEADSVASSSSSSRSPESVAASLHPPAQVRKGCALAGFGGVSAPPAKVPELHHHHHHSEAASVASSVSSSLPGMATARARRSHQREAARRRNRSSTSEGSLPPLPTPGK